MNSCVPLSLANADGTINSNLKSALFGIFSTGVEIATAVSSPYVSNAMVGACVLINGHELIQNLGKPAGRRTFSGYADIFSKSIFFHISQGAASVDVLFDRYVGTQSTKSQTRVKRGLRAKKLIRKVKADLAAFLVRRSCEEISKCPSRVRISFGRRHRKSKKLHHPAEKSSCIDL